MISDRDRQHHPTCMCGDPTTRTLHSFIGFRKPFPMRTLHCEECAKRKKDLFPTVYFDTPEEAKAARITEA